MKNPERGPGVDSEAHTGADAPMLRVVFVIVVGMLVGLAALDVALAAVQRAGSTAPSLHVDDEQTVWRSASNYKDEWLSTDAYGLRNPGLPKDASTREVRILGLGDSRVFGARDFGPKDSETWHAQLQPLLDGKVVEGVRVLNGGVGGFSAMQASRHGARLIELIEPDLVLLFISPGGRCLIDVTSTYENIRVKGHLVPRDIIQSVPEAYWLEAGKTHDWLADHSPLYAHYRRVRADIGGDLGSLRSNFVLTDGRDVTPQAEFMVGQTFDSVRELRELAARRNCRVIAVMLYDSFAMDEGSWQRFLAAHANTGGPKLGTQRAATIGALRARLTMLKIDAWSVIDLQEKLCLNRPKYFAEDGRDWEHLSALANGLLAAELLKEIEKRNILKELSESRRRHPRR